MRFRPAHQSMINRRHDDRASCLARQRLKPLLPMEPRIHAPATWKGGHESGANLTFDTLEEDPENPKKCWPAEGINRMISSTTEGYLSVYLSGAGARCGRN